MQAVQDIISSSAKNDVLNIALSILACPACGACVELEDPEVWRRDCGRTYSRDHRNGVIYFVEEESSTESFGLQWKTFSRERLDNDRLREEVFRWFREAGLTDIDLLDSEDGWVSVRGQAPAHSSLD